MVDPTKGIGGVSNVISGNKSEQIAEKKEKSRESGEAGALAPHDEVQISEEALSLRQAEETARDVRAQLEESDETLSGSRAGALQDLLA